MKESNTPSCEGHNWELQQVMPEWTTSTDSDSLVREIALVTCPFCGITRKTVIENL